MAAPMKIPLKEIESIVDYLWYDEKKHFQEHLSKNLQSSDEVKHIFSELKIVREWLVQSKIFPTEAPAEASSTNPPQNWKDFTTQIVESYCHETNSKTFTLQDLQKAKKFEIESFSKKNKHPFDKIRQQLQFLRKDGFINFVDNNGTYSLMTTD